MLTKNRFPLFVAIILFLELVIYLWAVWTTNPEVVFDKCARNSGRVSSLINLSILLMIGYYGFKQLNFNEKKKDAFRILLTLFAINHLIHFFYVYQNFKHHSNELSTAENLHGFITFLCILIVPVVLWLRRNVNMVLCMALAVHLFNVSYFIMKTFYSKIKPEAPAYHNQLGIVVTTAALMYVLYRILREINSEAIRPEEV